MVILWVVKVVNNAVASNIQFKELKVPEPVDTQTNTINSQEAEAVSLITEIQHCFHFEFTFL